MDVNLTQMVGGNAGDTHISEPSLAVGYFFSHDHLTQLVTRLGLGQGSNNMQRWNIVALTGGIMTNITEP